MAASTPAHPSARSVRAAHLSSASLCSVKSTSKLPGSRAGARTSSAKRGWPHRPPQHPVPLGPSSPASPRQGCRAPRSCQGPSLQPGTRQPLPRPAKVSPASHVPVGAVSWCLPAAGRISSAHGQHVPTHKCATPHRHTRMDTLNTHAYTRPRYPTPADTRGFGADQFSTGKTDLVHLPTLPLGAGTHCCPVPPSSTLVPKHLRSSLGTLHSAGPAAHRWVYFLFQAHFSMKIRLIRRGKAHEKLLSSFSPQKSLAHDQKER